MSRISKFDRFEQWLLRLDAALKEANDLIDNNLPAGEVFSIIDDLFVG